MRKTLQQLCDLLPADTNWGDTLGPSIVQHIVDKVARERPKEHIVREFVNQLRDVAVQYHAHQSLRERVSHVVSCFIEESRFSAQDSKVCDNVVTARAVSIERNLEMKPRAVVTACAISNVSQHVLYVSEREMSTDLPAEDLGELVASCVQGAWKNGHDPVTYHVSTSFR